MNIIFLIQASMIGILITAPTAMLALPYHMVTPDQFNPN